MNTWTHEYCHNMSTWSALLELWQEPTKRSGTKPHEESGMGSRRKKNCAALWRAHQQAITSKHGITWHLTFNPFTFLTCRLPILQGGTFSFITPTLAILALPKWQCPAPKAPAVLSEQIQNITSPLEMESSDEVWMARMREVWKMFNGARRWS